MFCDFLPYKNISCAGENTEEHDERLERVRRKLLQAGQPEEIAFSQSQVKFLGQMIDESGVYPDPEKIPNIKNVSPPNTVSDVQRFLGMSNRRSEFSPNQAERQSHCERCLAREIVGEGGASTASFCRCKRSIDN